MYYLPTDYLALTAIRDKKTSLNALLETVCASLPYPLTKHALAFSLGKLAAGGYIEGYALTDKGVAFFKSNKKFLEGKSKANARLCALLCSQQVNGVSVTPYEFSDAGYIEACDALRRKYVIPSPDFYLQTEDNDFVLTFGNAYADEDGQDIDAAVRDQKIRVNADSLCELCHALLAYCEDGRHHKCCLYADGAPAYVATVSTNEGTMRLAICKILYNRQRFIGKCDGDLDYAQCGEFAYDRTANDTLTKFALAMVQIEHLLADRFPYPEVTALMEL